MHLYVELWKPKAAWQSLGAAERNELLARLGPLTEALAAEGVELIGFALNDEDTAHRAEFLYLALWQMPSRALAKRLEDGLIESGFHECFEQVNARGECIDPEALLRHMMELPR